MQKFSERNSVANTRNIVYAMLKDIDVCLCFPEKRIWKYLAHCFWTLSNIRNFYSSISKVTGFIDDCSYQILLSIQMLSIHSNPRLCRFWQQQVQELVVNFESSLYLTLFDYFFKYKARGEWVPANLELWACTPV